MKVISIRIEASSNFFCAYGLNVNKICAGGATIAAVKESVFECIEIVKSFDDKNVPAALKGEYEIVWKFEIGSVLAHYLNIFNPSGFARVIGIKESQLNNYASGQKKPRAAQAKKIVNALHRLGNELISIKL